jgi:outer-membrane receptor for ferric coprogen and ferric-rhodotorulic acid
MNNKAHHTPLAAAALACLALLNQAHAQTPAPAAAEPAAAQEAAPQKITVAAKRERRISKGATNLPLEIKDTPQSISTIDAESLRNFGTSSSNDALHLGTGIHVEEWETNRTSYVARGFEVMLTQVDGVGMANDWGLVVGQLETYLFERIELVRGANGLLTGVGNASGTINYVRKRPTNKDGGEFIAAAGSLDFGRVALDYNKVLSADGAWAGRLVAAHENKASYLRGLEDQRTALHGVVEGQLGDNGVLTLGFAHQGSKQRSPMWGSLTLIRANGSQAEFDVSASTAQDWARWNLGSSSAFVEYAHTLSSDWEAKLSVNHRRGDEDVKLFYAYSLTGTLNNDNTGLIGWPYRSDLESSSTIVDGSLTGRYSAFGRRHELTLGLSHSKQKTYSEAYSITSAPGPALPAFPYPGNFYPEPTWGATSVGSDGNQKLTRLYAVTRLALTDSLKGIAGLNAISLKRDGTSIYGGGVNLDNETTEKASPYVGITYDITPNVLGYVSYSDIFQAQDQRDANGRFLAPMKGVNAELGVKAEWLDRRLLTTFAVFDAEQKGLATEVGFDLVAQRSIYAPKDVRSRGFEAEVTGRVGAQTNLTVGYTQLKLTGPDGNDIYEWVPRKSLKLRADTRLPVLPALKLGAAARWQSDVAKIAGAKQDAYWVLNAFAAYDITPAATLRLNVDNLADEKYVRTVQYGAIYGAPRRASLWLEYKL